MLRAFVAQSMLHALVAGLLVEVLLAAWRVDDGTWRLRLRLLALAEPILVLPLFFLVPWRSDASFAVNWALFASERWNLLRVAGAGFGDLLLLCLMGVGAVLFLRDAAPPLLEPLRGPARNGGPGLPVPPALAAMVDAHARTLGIVPPAVRVTRLRAPVLLCEQASRPTLVISAGAIARLDRAQLDAAVGHELAHAAHRDPAWGYVLIAVRAITFFNPAMQWTARAAVGDIERRADQVAVRLTGRPDALAAAVRALVLGESRPLSDMGGRFERMFWSSQVTSVERRCRRLLEGGPIRPLGHGALRVALAAAGIVGLLFFVV